MLFRYILFFYMKEMLEHFILLTGKLLFHLHSLFLLQRKNLNKSIFNKHFNSLVFISSVFHFELLIIQKSIHK